MVWSVSMTTPGTSDVAVAERGRADAVGAGGEEQGVVARAVGGRVELALAVVRGDVRAGDRVAGGGVA